MSDLSFTPPRGRCSLSPRPPRPCRSSRCRRAGSGGATRQPTRASCSIRSATICSSSSPGSATSLGMDTGARAALRSQLEDRSAAGQQRLSRPAQAGSRARRGVRRVGPVVPGTHQRRGRAQRLQDRARRFRAALWRRRGRRLAQHALRRDPERRRLSRYPALPRRRASDRDQGRRRGLSRAASGLSEAARRRARADALGPRGRARRRRISCSTRRSPRWRSTSKDTASGGSLVESIERRTKAKSIAGDWAGQGPHDRAAAGASRAPAADGRAQGAARGREERSPACGRARTATNITAGRSRPRPRRP